MTDFVEWLEEELEARNWTRNTLSEKSGVDSGLLTKIANRKRNAGPETLNKIAAAFRYDPEILFRKAGLLPPMDEKRKVAESIVAYRLADLSDRQLEEVLWYIDAVVTRDEELGPPPEPEPRRSQSPEYKSREGSSPPEVVND